jgi:hypothetical protein
MDFGSVWAGFIVQKSLDGAEFSDTNGAVFIKKITTHYL